MNYYSNRIAGESRKGEYATRNINPSDTSDLIGEYAQASVDDVHDALNAARKANETWAFSNPQQRADVLDAAANEILARKVELGNLLAREEGKTLPEGIGEVGRAAMIFKYFAGEALRLGGEVLPSVRPNVKVEVTREPVGVVGIITPWNFPIAIPAWKIAPALAYGNCVVLKPAEIAPGCAWELVDILHRAGLSAGVLNLVMGKGSVVGPAMIAGVDAVSFTGSSQVGHGVREMATNAGARVQLEMGGKNPLIVLDDADINTAVNCAIQGAFYSSGQRCTASSRIIVTQAIAEQFVQALTKATQALKVGDARDKATQIGPVASADQMQTVLRYIKVGVEEGATMIAGNEPLESTGVGRGYYIRPTLFDHTTPDMLINRDEIFGPVASIIRVADYNAALAIANATEYGLTAGICTTSLRYAEDFKRRAQVGMTMVNLPTAGVDYHVPFGGRKASSYGPREQGSYAREFFTTVKTSYQFAG
jgi:alpha-ketoglutaric semialdehyde dehydrogenase